VWGRTHYDLSIKIIKSALRVLKYIITSMAACPSVVAAIFDIKSVSTFKAAIILYVPLAGLYNILNVFIKYSETCLNQTLSKQKTCLNQTLSKQKTCLNRTLSKQKTCLNQTLSKQKTCLNQTELTVPSIKCPCKFNLCKTNTCLNWTTFSVPKRFGLDRFNCTFIHYRENSTRFIRQTKYSITKENTVS
jgi:hypothetical protein